MARPKIGASRQKTTLALVTAVALIATGMTWFVGLRIKSPSEVAARAKPPTPSLMTVPVKRQQLNQNIVTRGTVTPSDSIEVSASGVDEGGKLIVTGLPKESGDDVREGEPVAEVSGRPIIALQGDLPVFRDLRPGTQGTDVLQLEESLQRLGHSPGQVDEKFDANTSKAVASLYKATGYRPNDATKEEQEAIRAARQQVQDSEQALAEANKALKEAGAESADFQAAVTRAEEALKAARGDLDRLVEETGAYLPGPEIVFVPTLPQQIAQIRTKVGETPSEPILAISGSETVIRSAVSAPDRKLLEVRDAAVVEQEELGLAADVTISTIAANPGGGDLKDNQYAVEFVSSEPLPEEVIEASVRITIPVSASDGEVLVVPLAAVSAGPDGGSRVEVATGDGTKTQTKDDKTKIVQVVVGLTADGLVEVKPANGETLSEGDRVVVGQDLDLSDVADNQDEDTKPDEEEDTPAAPSTKTSS